VKGLWAKCRNKRNFSENTEVKSERCVKRIDERINPLYHLTIYSFSP